jgi:hypothetical protein
LEEKVGNLRRGGRLGRVKPIFRCIKPLDGAASRTVSCLVVSQGEEGFWHYIYIMPLTGCRESETPGEAEAQESHVLIPALNKQA